jgi:hypothetical protein
MATATAKGQLGPISDHETYPVSVFMRLTGLSKWAMRSARSAGLVVRTVGKRRYVRGADWSAFLATIEE